MARESSVAGSGHHLPTKVKGRTRSERNTPRLTHHFRVFIFVCLGLVFGASLQAAELLPRKILALVDGAVDEDIDTTKIHHSAELPLNFLGMEVIYRKVADPLPADSEMTGTRGILTWFDKLNAVPDPANYCSWLQHQMQKGRRVVILEEPGIFKDAKRELIPECRKMFEALGVRYDGETADNPFYFTVVSKDSDMVEFERKLLLTEGQKFSRFKTFSPKAHVYLKMKRRDLSDSLSDMIFTTPAGGFAHASYVMFIQKDIQKQQWRLNPFRFFEEAFGLQGWPRPDVTTANGRRIFYTQIDGDGIFNISHIDRESFSGEIIYEKILKVYPNVPVTVGIITGYLDMREYRSPRAMTLYRNIFSLPNVEPASHGYAHPLIWKKRTVALRISGYHYDPAKEILGSVTMVQELLKELGIDKKVGLFQWTGDAIMNEAEIALANQGEALDINGGDHRFDHQFDSVSFLSPLAIRKGNARQIYSSNSNENVYTNLWHGPYYGFRDVAETFANTESPRRLAPIDLYYHFYSGERVASLKVLRELHDQILAQDIFPMRTSEFARRAGDFFRVRLESLGDGGVRVTQAGHSRTVRWDREPRGVDLTRSKGVLGFMHHRGSLYVALDEAPVHDIYLTLAKPARPYVISTNCAVKNFSGSPQQLHFAKRGWYKSEAIIGGMALRQRYRIQAGGASSVVATDGDGKLQLKFSSSEGDGPFADVTVQLASD